MTVFAKLFHSLRDFFKENWRSVVIFIVGSIFGYILALSKILITFYQKIPKNLSFVSETLNKPIWATHSSYDLGVAITALAIIVAFIEFISERNELRFWLNIRKRKVALWLTAISVLLSFLGEFNTLGRPFLFEIIAAILILASIITYLNVILKSLRKVSKKQIKTLQEILIGVLTSREQDTSKVIKGLTQLFDNLLEYYESNQDVKDIFKNDFTSEIFLKHFSESGYVFEQTIKYYQKKVKEGKIDLYHLEFFLKRLITKALENQESFLNIYLDEKIYPESLFYLDEVVLKEKNRKVLQTLFGQNRFSGLNENGQLNYVNLVSRYFRFVQRQNNHVSLPNGYQKNYDLNEEVIIIFFDEIRDFFESCFEQKHLDTLLGKLESFSWHYRWSIITEDKSIRLRTKTGEFLYEVFYKFISKYKIDDEEIFRLRAHNLYYHFIEVQENEFEGNIAYNSFTTKLKDKIIGTEGDNFSPNYKGFFPAMILVYFYIFGFEIFSHNNSFAQKTLHIPILTKLSESFPKLYTGFKQEFYDAESLPESKKDLLEKQGKEILDKFLKKNMVYDFNENSLSYYYSGEIHSSKILLNDVKNKQLIEPIKI